MIAVFRSLIVDTFRQSLASRIFWVMLAVSGLCTLFCLSVGFINVPVKAGEGLPQADPLADPVKAEAAGLDVFGGEITYGFGVIRMQVDRDRQNAVQFILAVLAGLVAGSLGLLLTLVWTAGFFPSFLEPSAASVLLAKPIHRWQLLLGKFVGLLVFVALHAAVFVLGTWLALGVKSGVWVPAYLWCVPMLVLQFAVFASVSVLLAVVTRSTVVCVFGSILFWMVCWAINYGRHKVYAVPELRAAVSVQMVNAGYWVMPKPVDFGMLFFDAIGAHNYFAEAVDLKPIRQEEKATKQTWQRPTLALVTSLLFSLGILGLAMYQFRHTDY